MNCQILCGGLQVLQPTNPFDEEKGEARSSASTAGSTPTEPPSNFLPVNTRCSNISHTTLETNPSVNNNIQQRIERFIYGLAEARITEPLVVTWHTISERYCKDNNLIWHQEFLPEHPVQELERLLTAVLIRHQSLGGLVLTLLEKELTGVRPDVKLPIQIGDLIRLIYQTKWSVVRTRQQLNRSYKEVCAPMLDRLRFLLYEVRPTISLEQEGFTNLSILHRLPRFKQVVRKIILDMRAWKKQLACAKPEDILNVTIQSQQQNAQKLNQSQESLPNEDTVVTFNIQCENVLDSSTKNSEIKCSAEVMKLQDTALDFEIEKKPETEYTINNHVLKKLNEKWYFSGELKHEIMQEIVEFVMQEDCDVETVRRAMFCQVQRYQVRKQGLDMFYTILQVDGLLDTVQYNMLNGFLGLHLKMPSKCTHQILEDLHLTTAFQKANLLLSHSRIIDWAVNELQSLVNQELVQMKSKNNLASDKDNSNLGTYVFLKKLPRARFLLSVFGILAKDMNAQELSLLINSGTLGTILGLLSQAGCDSSSVKNTYELSVVYEDTILKQNSNKANLTGPELAKLMKIGTRIVRGADWKWGDQDGNPPGEGRIISEMGEDG